MSGLAGEHGEIAKCYAYCRENQCQIEHEENQVRGKSLLEKTENKRRYDGD